MSQHALAKRLDISSQQVHKYETGLNSVGASIMAQIADILQKPPSWFFAAVDKQEADVEQEILDRFVASAEGIRLARAFQAIENKAIRAAISAFVGEIASSREGNEAGLMH
jgi:transcriptional regulator with XRE-family HTH domain